MLFNSIEFAFFLPIVFILYWFITNKNLKFQNILLLVSSYVFYGWWDWRFLSLIVFSSFVDYFVGLGLGKTEDSKKRKLLLWVSILVNLGFLGFFKYYNFFAESFADAFTLFGKHINPARLNIVLPVGISFYTIDVYKRKLEPTKDIVAFFAFVSFFPQLVAGPIERASNLLPQFYKKRQFEYDNAVDGMRQILWGLFKKIVIADNAAMYANDIFNNYEAYSGSTLLLGAVFFSFQIYGDFSGYSDIAIGTSRLFGFNLMQNFAFPYFSRDIAEFWRRWHISLSTWFRDYLYIPLGGSRGSTLMKVKNTFIIFVVSGFWHGANWTFIAWGFLNALYFLPLLLRNKNRIHTNTVAEGKIVPSSKELLQIAVTFFITIIAWIFFRAANIHEAFSYLYRMFSLDFFETTILDLKKISVGAEVIYFSAILILFIIIEWIQRNYKHALYLTNRVNRRWNRWILYYIIGLMIIWFGGKQQIFIYFQF